MTISQKCLFPIFSLLLTMIIWNCGRVPKEVVELSYASGQDLAAINSSYVNAIHTLYDQLRQQRLDYLDNQWTPAFVALWVRKGKLIEIAKGELIWLEDEAEFAAPQPDHGSKELLESVQKWGEEAIYEIEAKRDSLLNPLDQEEKQLLSEINQAFEQLIRANATITAHLNSLRKVQEVQDSALAALNISDLRDKINLALESASSRASEALVKIREADEKAINIKGKLKSVIK
ncbi:conserved hypothetical protein [Candidatus Zixiibacteriota bacterium]|nr:conserved hypothetical protein [candidate division Zixibacteria bacterium]